ncbi:MAG: hypothetical protein OEW68_06835 [Gammaproteobacteria bacterium]|nr:hypothetical protein [Gammaproteobacteria bacterium]MDH5213980.1 hypothetical protein [Gammaproteobacteria bacterium]
MNRFLQWLGYKLFGRKPAADKSLHQTGRRVMPSRAPSRPPPPAPAPVQFDAAVTGEIEDGGPGKNVLIRNRMVREDTGTHDTLKILDDSLLESEEEFGIDPYNTGRFDRSQSWSSRTRK